METDVVTADGILVRTNGTLIWPDGTVRMMMEDEALPINVATTEMEET